MDGDQSQTSTARPQMPEVDSANEAAHHSRPAEFRASARQRTKHKLPERAREKKVFAMFGQENCRSVFCATLAFPTPTWGGKNASPGQNSLRTEIAFGECRFTNARPHFLLPQRRADGLSLVLLFPMRPARFCTRPNHAAFPTLLAIFQIGYKYKHCWGASHLVPK
jgi:hypothetical protein